MKNVLKFWTAIIGGLVLLWSLLHLYDKVFANGDGLLASIDLDRLLAYLIGLVVTLGIVSFGTKSRFHWITNLSAAAFGLLSFWIVAEFLCFVLISLDITKAPRPFHSRLRLNEQWNASNTNFWGDLSPKFGRWRLPNSSIEIPICNGDTVILTSNSFGMRDKERQLTKPSNKKRAVLLGDSFMEGYLVDEPQRYSNLLEAQTGREHLNFGINGTSPINYYLTYDNLASRFEHDVVIITLLPANDFEDYEKSQELGLLRYPIYRPYWQGDFPDVNLSYSLADIRQSIAAPNNYQRPKQVQQTVDSLYHNLGFGKKVIAEIQLNSYLYSCALHWAGLGQASSGAARSGDATEDMVVMANSYAKKSFESRWAVMEYSLTKLLKSAQGKKVILLGVPILSDIEAYDQQPIDDLSPRLLAICRQTGATYLNLLPVFHKLGAEQWKKLYVPCDGHFSSKGERLVAKTLMELPEYRNAMGLEKGQSITQLAVK